MILFRHILMNDVVGEPGQRKLSAGEADFDFIRRGKFADAIEDFSGLFLSSASSRS